MSLERTVGHSYERVASGVFGWLVPYKHLTLVRQVPNLLSFSRLSIAYLVVPLYRAIANQHRSDAVWWFALITFIGFTDAWDGPLARTLQVAESAVGKLLDPLSDKVLAGSLVIIWQILLFRAHLGSITMAVFGVALLAGLLELCLVTFSLVGAAKHLKLGANRYGKYKLHYQCLAILAAMIGFIGYGQDHAVLVAWNCASLVLLLTACYYAFMSLSGHLEANRPTLTA